MLEHVWLTQFGLLCWRWRDALRALPSWPRLACADIPLALTSPHTSSTVRPFGQAMVMPRYTSREI